MKILFDVKHLYYLPQYLPVYKKLVERGIACGFIFYKDKELDTVINMVIDAEELPALIVDTWNNALLHYKQEKPHWVIFGDAVPNIEIIHQHSKTALMQHGIGPKSCYYDVSQNLTTVRFVEGQHRLNRLLGLYPDGNFVDVGYAKLDPIINNQFNAIDLSSLGLDPNKPTLLYAPTFYPSSIGCFEREFPQQLKEFNIILKPHFFSLTKSKYKKQQQMLDLWGKQDNVYLAKISEYNLLPFMAISDVLISDASSAIFEFSALNKPVVWCDFYKLRWTYRGLFKYRFKQRLDSDIDYFYPIAEHVSSYKGLITAVKKVISNPDLKSQQQIEITEKLAGKVDGLCSDRVCDVLLLSECVE